MLLRNLGHIGRQEKEFDSFKSKADGQTKEIPTYFSFFSHEKSTILSRASFGLVMEIDHNAAAWFRTKSVDGTTFVIVGLALDCQ